MKSSIAFFDFDGTITSKDTLFEIIKYQKGKRALYVGLVKLSPWLIAMKLRIISNAATKEKVLTFFFKDTPLQDFQRKCDAFIAKELPRLIRPAALREINKHKQNNTTVVIVTASAENWTAGWCRQNQISCIATKLEIKEGKITGRIDGKNCNGIEKVNRIKTLFRLDAYETISAYGDTKGDKPMLSLAAFAYYKPFRERL
ncbi:HAD family hydrolase [Agriterribacter sp.]|uniref:HAD family hydrolase n=1 Tax=Agriterribacter sp. TaxID=2821509 RepID=UPI002C7AEDA9|nr:HAD family hydrolase [Agriterribacter sp.]HRO47886.1 HAD family hydrolase [Agriterribacter sp.]HRQ18818.1 HAD family hydrolase [Agriterribacter sp.]